LRPGPGQEQPGPTATEPRLHSGRSGGRPTAALLAGDEAAFGRPVAGEAGARNTRGPPARPGRRGPGVLPAGEAAPLARSLGVCPGARDQRADPASGETRIGRALGPRLGRGPAPELLAAAGARAAGRRGPGCQGVRLGALARPPAREISSVHAD